jgi:hypothetical protein
MREKEILSGGGMDKGLEAVSCSSWYGLQADVPQATAEERTDLMVRGAPYQSRPVDLLGGYAADLRSRFHTKLGARDVEEKRSLRRQLTEQVGLASHRFIAGLHRCHH